MITCRIDANSGPFLTLFQFIGVSIYALLLNIKYEVRILFTFRKTKYL